MQKNMCLHENTQICTIDRTVVLTTVATPCSDCKLSSAYVNKADDRNKCPPWRFCSVQNKE